MKNTTTTIAIIFFLLALIVVAVLVFRNGNADRNISVEELTEKPSIFRGGALFILNDYEGTEVSSNEFNSEVLVINAWASWCPFCVNELPDFAKLASAFPEEVSVVAVNRAEPLSTAKSYSDRLGLENEVTFLVDPDDKFYKSIGGFSMPETLFVNKKGEVLLHKRGPMNFEEMSELIESFLNL